jgi:hypothetical protein
MARPWRRRAAKDPGPPPDPTIVPIAHAQARRRVRVQGQVVRMTTRPVQGLPSLAILVSDDTGTVSVVFAGRREIGGISLGRRLVVEGVAVDVAGTLEFTNPAYTLLPPVLH